MEKTFGQSPLTRNLEKLEAAHQALTAIFSSKVMTVDMADRKVITEDQLASEMGQLTEGWTILKTVIKELENDYFVNSLTRALNSKK